MRTFAENMASVNQSASEFLAFATQQENETIRDKSFQYLDLMNQGMNEQEIRTQPGFDYKALFAAQGLHFKQQTDKMAMSREQIAMQMDLQKQRYATGTELAKQAHLAIQAGDHKAAMTHLAKAYNMSYPDGSFVTAFDDDNNLENGFTLRIKHPDGTEETLPVTTEKAMGMLQDLLDPQNFPKQQLAAMKDAEQANINALMSGGMDLVNKDGKVVTYYRTVNKLTGQWQHTLIDPEGGKVILSDDKFKEFMQKGGYEAIASLQGKRKTALGLKAAEMGLAKTAVETEKLGVETGLKTEQIETEKAKQEYYRAGVGKREAETKTGTVVNIGGGRTVNLNKEQVDKLKILIKSVEDENYQTLSLDEAYVVQKLEDNNWKEKAQRAKGNKQAQAGILEMLGNLKTPRYIYEELADMWEMDADKLKVTPQ